MHRFELLFCFLVYFIFPVFAGYKHSLTQDEPFTNVCRKKIRTIFLTQSYDTYDWQSDAAHDEQSQESFREPVYYNFLESKADPVRRGQACSYAHEANSIASTSLGHNQGWGLSYNGVNHSGHVIDPDTTLSLMIATSSPDRINLSNVITGTSWYDILTKTHQKYMDEARKSFNQARSQIEREIRIAFSSLGTCDSRASLGYSHVRSLYKGYQVIAKDEISRLGLESKLQKLHVEVSGNSVVKKYFGNYQLTFGDLGAIPFSIGAALGQLRILNYSEGWKLEEEGIRELQLKAFETWSKLFNYFKYEKVSESLTTLQADSGGKKPPGLIPLVTRLQELIIGRRGEGHVRLNGAVWILTGFWLITESPRRYKFKMQNGIPNLSTKFKKRVNDLAAATWPPVLLAIET
ncbi:hypothetical protein O181_062550 [Austropuccinia psidii MF-1]|uniref:Uncharacterized protein n=1 Tax=Austropuccinia psidii MF-1 TaxID=1389203 RepID=A0A9Q3I1F6_9BASI|nr:hypothetical protein [Austropuccinia psidii MF-1]